MTGRASLEELLDFVELELDCAELLEDLAELELGCTLLELDFTELEDFAELELDFSELLDTLELDFAELDEAGGSELLEATLELLGSSCHTAETNISPEAVAGISVIKSEPYLQPRNS